MGVKNPNNPIELFSDQRYGYGDSDFEDENYDGFEMIPFCYAHGQLEDDMGYDLFYVSENDVRVLLGGRTLEDFDNNPSRNCPIEKAYMLVRITENLAHYIVIMIEE